MYRCVSDTSHRRAVCRRWQPMHFLLYDRTQREYSLGVPRALERLDFWMRHLSGRMSVESFFKASYRAAFTSQSRTAFDVRSRLGRNHRRSISRRFPRFASQKDQIFRSAAKHRFSQTTSGLTSDIKDIGLSLLVAIYSKWTRPAEGGKRYYIPQGHNPLKSALCRRKNMLRNATCRWRIHPE